MIAKMTASEVFSSCRSSATKPPWLLRLASAWLFVVMILVGHQITGQQTSGQIASLTSSKRIPSQHLPNLLQVADEVFSGGIPESDAGFEELRERGIKTLISVDGAKPDVEAAHRFGLRYVHLPHGYDGIPDKRILELAKAVRDLDGPIYIHCHHGEHRSPAAAAAACVAAGKITLDEAPKVLQLAGTNPNYVGLFESVAATQAIDKTVLDSLQVEFQESVELPTLTQMMVEIDHCFEFLQAMSKAGWKTQSNSKKADLTPAQASLLLREHFTELVRSDYVAQQPEEFKQLLRASQRSTEQLELAMTIQVPVTDDQRLRYQALLDRVASDCKSCHSQYRDVRPKP